jgi:dTMP kinase
MWKETYGEVPPQARKHIFTADRIMIMREVIENLRAGKIVIGIRSFLTTIAYQGMSQFEMAEIAFLHRFVPRPDLAIILDVEPEIALERIGEALATNERSERGDHEDLEQMRLHLQRLEEIIASFLPPLIPTAIIDGNPLASIVHDKIIQDITVLNLFEGVAQNDP